VNDVPRYLQFHRDCFYECAMNGVAEIFLKEKGRLSCRPFAWSD
jgi:hypothetical protein